MTTEGAATREVRLDEFRDRVVRWHEENLPSEWGTEGFPGFSSEQETVEFLVDWQRKLYDGGFAGLAWPREYGGRGAGLLEQLVYVEVRDYFRAPTEWGVIGSQMVGPSIIAHGSEWQKTTFLPRILTGADIWCQGFSEPNAGSDLARLETRATRVDGGWLIKGQKLWTSRAHTASEMIVLARTNAEAPRHRGITAFLVSMASRGLTVRPIRQINFNDEFNEVFIDDVLVPDERVLGAVDDGWNVAVNTLNSERIATTRAFEARRLVADLACAGEHVDAHVLADLTMRAYAAGLTLRRYAEEAERADIGSKASVTKLVSSELTVELARVGALMDPTLTAALPLKEGSPPSWGGLYLNNLKNTIAAGTSQVQRNVIAQRILGMPREVVVQ